MKKARKRKMLIAFGVLLILVGALMIWFNISYSPVKKQFQNDAASLVEHNKLPNGNDVFTKDDFADFSTAIQKYIENCGYIWEYCPFSVSRYCRKIVSRLIAFTRDTSIPES